ncbi:hypothetical protein AB833_32175 [Chromatiales bacterium (ex Bugula neritina AB1)]|nr:hypothetical protein AB833_32175 [Chromatiales bacterium (ex Bugula neritina AB1)]
MQSSAPKLSLAKQKTEEFNRIQKLVYKHTAIVIADDKQDFVRARISKRMRTLNIQTLGEYCDRVESGRESLTQFTNQVTTNHTHFFRENHHFDTLVKHLAEIGPENRTIWSSACSSGEEPYSIAISLAEYFEDIFSSDIRIIASDIDQTIIDKAAQAIYSEDKIESLDRTRKKFAFVKGKGELAGKVRVKKPLRDLIEYKRLNLVEPFDFNSRIDIIFCRNVVIYFDKSTKIDLFNRFSELQEPGDLLFVGHSESLNELCDSYTCLGGTTYQRK